MALHAGLDFAGSGWIIACCKGSARRVECRYGPMVEVRAAIESMTGAVGLQDRPHRRVVPAARFPRPLARRRAGRDRLDR
jgi:hypothetical protein